MENNRNFLIAMALSIAVLVGWQFLVVSPRMAHKKATETAADDAGAGSGRRAADPADAGRNAQTDVAAPAGRESVTAPAGGPAEPAAATREAALAAAPRVPIDTPAVYGSINLRGARLDDLRLKNYHETVDKSSPTIVLLSPESQPDGYFAELAISAATQGIFPDPRRSGRCRATRT